MGEVAYNLQQYPAHNVEIIVHIDEMLEETKRADLVNILEGIEGIRSAEFCPLRWHLMLINYDKQVLNSQEVLTGVVANNIHAELIGPV
ncbi:MAG: hypothetical protein OEV12_02505 [Gammaproteobacteria bacterium]|jgi:hypothetical protein|nr:hypothetical protein [Gammaproteobacteria bacterium]MDH3887721.1 hypothetical protein [Gammaproteobacteria bacterium]MDH3934630.1 hypothetical protein [Gammaproteobacteria bacterium]MDH3985269.1 hypothetical protein [Gammaproteobacteria bacterium]